MTIYDYYYDDDYIYYICNVSLFKMQLLEHVVNRKRQQKTNRTKTKNNNNKEILFNIEIACVSYVSYRYFIYFLQRLYKKKMENIFIIIIITLYIYDYDYNYK